MSLVSSSCQRNTPQDRGIPRQSFRKCLRTQLHARTPPRLVAQRFRQFGAAYQKMGHMSLSLAGDTICEPWQHWRHGVLCLKNIERLLESPS